jgi:hypothetical protein
MGLFCASEIAGRPSAAIPAVATAPFSSLRRDAPTELWVYFVLMLSPVFSIFSCLMKLPLLFFFITQYDD